MQKVLYIVAAIIAVLGVVMLLNTRDNDASTSTVVENKNVAFDLSNQATEAEADYCFEYTETMTQDVLEGGLAVSAGNVTGSNVDYAFVLDVPEDAEVENVDYRDGVGRRVALGRDEEGGPYQSFTVFLHRPERGLYQDGYPERFIYEGLSNQWHVRRFDSNFYRRCAGNEYGKTDAGDSIYRTGSGDAGVSNTSYLIPVEVEGQNFLVVVSISNEMLSDGEDNLRGSNYQDFDEMKDVVESVVKTLRVVEGEAQG